RTRFLNRLVDAMREVAAALEREVEGGRRSAQINAHDLIETLLAIADRLEPRAFSERPGLNRYQPSSIPPIEPRHHPLNQFLKPKTSHKAGASECRSKCRGGMETSLCIRARACIPREPGLFCQSVVGLSRSPGLTLSPFVLRGFLRRPFMSAPSIGYR